MRTTSLRLLLATALLGFASPAAAFTITFGDADFEETPLFNEVPTYLFEIEVEGPLEAGTAYGNGSLVDVRYLLFGQLTEPTPSGFPSFLLSRLPSGEGTITPEEWDAQSSSFFFETAADADLSDGLQISDLVADALGVVFRFDAREFQREDRGRYHPPILLLFEDGTGLLKNSNNSSDLAVNPGTREFVDIEYGDEYVVSLSGVDGVTLASVPEAGAGALLLVAAGVLAHRRRP